jgi:hypothetical protein
MTLFRVSLDDFGAVSVHKLLNDPSEKEMPLPKFLDQLLRPVPTTTEPIEMGGSIELNDAERDNLEVRHLAVFPNHRKHRLLYLKDTTCQL